MTKEQLEKAFYTDCTERGEDGKPYIKRTPEELINWIAERFCQEPKDNVSLFTNAFTGMYDKKGKPIHEGDNVRLYYKGDYFICKVVYDVRHAAFFIKWHDGYVNQYFMNGPNYEVLTDTPKTDSTK